MWRTGDKLERATKVGLWGHLNLTEPQKVALSRRVDCAAKAVTQITIMSSRAGNHHYLKVLEEGKGLYSQQEEERRVLEENHAIAWQGLMVLQQDQLMQHWERQSQDRQLARHIGGDQDQLQQQHHLENATLIGDQTAQQLEVNEMHRNLWISQQDIHYEEQKIRAPDQGFFTKLYKLLNPSGIGDGEAWAREAFLNIYEVDNFEQVPKANDRVGDKRVPLSRMLEYAARKMAANTRNHVTKNFYDHFTSAVRIVATQIWPSFNTGKKNKSKRNRVVYLGVSWMIEAERGEPLIGEAAALALLLEKQGGLIDDDLAGNETKQAVSRGVWEYVVKSVRFFGGAENVYKRLDGSDFHNLIPWLHEISCEIGYHNDSIRYDPANADYFAGLGFGLPPPQLKVENTFTIIPLNNLNKVQHIKIDERTAYSLIKDIVNLPEKGAYYQQHTAELWGIIFNLADIRKKRFRSGEKYWEFSGCMTDGVSLNVHHTRNMTDDEIAEARDQRRRHVSKGKLEVTPRDQWPENVEDRQLVGVDPGTNLTCAGADEVAPEGQDNRPRHPSKTFQPPQPPSRKSKACNKKKKWPKKSRNGKRRKQLRGGRKKQIGRRREKVYQCSNDCWRHETGSKEAQSNSIKRLQSTPVFYEDYYGNEIQTTLYDVKVKTPPAKVVTSEQFLPHCRHVRKFLDNIVDDMMVRKVRRARFDRHMKKKAAFDKVCHGITFGMNDAIVVFGNCTGQKSCFPFPTKEIVRHLQHYKDTRVIIFDEFRTSKCCSKCAFNQDLRESRGDPMVGENKKRGKKKGYWPIYGVRVCKNCGTRWHRDINAARNMRLIFLYMVENRLWQPDHIPVRPFPFSRLAQEAALAQEVAAALAQAQAEAHHPQQQ